MKKQRVKYILHVKRLFKSKWIIPSIGISIGIGVHKITNGGKFKDFYYHTPQNSYLNHINSPVKYICIIYMRNSFLIQVFFVNIYIEHEIPPEHISIKIRVFWSSLHGALTDHVSYLVFGMFFKLTFPSLKRVKCKLPWTALRNFVAGGHPISPKYFVY